MLFRTPPRYVGRRGDPIPSSTTRGGFLRAHPETRCMRDLHACAGYRNQRPSGRSPDPGGDKDKRGYDRDFDYDDYDNDSCNDNDCGYEAGRGMGLAATVPTSW